MSSAACLDDRAMHGRVQHGPPTTAGTAAPGCPRQAEHASTPDTESPGVSLLLQTLEGAPAKPRPSRSAQLCMLGKLLPQRSSAPAGAAATIHKTLSSYCRQPSPSQDGAVGWLESPACACSLAILLIRRLREVAGCRLHMQMSLPHGCAHASISFGCQRLVSQRSSHAHSLTRHTQLTS